MPRPRKASSNGAAAWKRALIVGAIALTLTAALGAAPLVHRANADGLQWQYPLCNPVMQTVTAGGGDEPGQPGPVANPTCPRMNHGDGPDVDGSPLILPGIHIGPGR